MKEEQVITQTDKKEEQVITQTGKKEDQVINDTDKKEEPVVTETQDAQSVQNVAQDMVSIKKQVEIMLQSRQSVEESENRISTLKGILTFLQKKYGQVLENSDDICEIGGMENTEQSVQKNKSDQRDKTNDAVYKH